MNSENSHAGKFSTDEEIRKLVLARLSVLSAETIKVIGDKGSFSRDELIQHVKSDDNIGQAIQKLEIEWLRALKKGILNELAQ